jgi:DNA replication licensing factor MCM2
MDAPRREIKKRFRTFLFSFKEEADSPGNPFYVERIREMTRANLQSLRINYIHLIKASSLLARYVADAPTEMLEIFDEVAKSVTFEMYRDYERIVQQV